MDKMKSEIIITNGLDFFVGIAAPLLMAWFGSLIKTIRNHDGLRFSLDTFLSRSLFGIFTGIILLTLFSEIMTLPLLIFVCTVGGYSSIKLIDLFDEMTPIFEKYLTQYIIKFLSDKFDDSHHFDKKEDNDQKK